MKEKNSIYIFDANIFLTGIDFNIIEGIIYTTPSIVDEVKASKYLEKNRNILNKIYAAIEAKKLKIKLPKDIYISKVIETSKKTGDFKALSDADKDLIALTLELIKNTDGVVQVYSNDYSVENVCDELNIRFSSLYKNGIESKIIWQIFCPHCKKIYKAEDLNQLCEICGTKLRRRPKK